MQCAYPDCLNAMLTVSNPEARWRLAMGLWLRYIPSMPWTFLSYLACLLASLSSGCASKQGISFQPEGSDRAIESRPAWLKGDFAKNDQILCLATETSPRCGPLSSGVEADPLVQLSEISGHTAIWIGGRFDLSIPRLFQWSHDGWQQQPLPPVVQNSADTRWVPTPGGGIAWTGTRATIWSLQNTRWTSHKLRPLDGRPLSLSRYHAGVVAWLGIRAKKLSLYRLSVNTGEIHSTLLDIRLPNGSFDKLKINNLRVSGQAWVFEHKGRLIFGEGSADLFTLTAPSRGNIRAVSGGLRVGMGPAWLQVAKTSVVAHTNTPGRMAWPGIVAVKIANCDGVALSWMDGGRQWFAAPQNDGFTVTNDGCPKTKAAVWPKLIGCEGKWIGMGKHRGACVQQRRSPNSPSGETWIQFGRLFP